MSSSQPPLLPHATRELARFAANTGFADIPPDIIERIKLSFIDGLGVCLQGSTLPWTQKVYALVRDEGGKPKASVWGTGHRTSLTNAVLVNSTAGHAFEMDDIHKESIVHPNSLAVPIVSRWRRPTRRYRGGISRRRSRLDTRSGFASAMPQRRRCF